MKLLKCKCKMLQSSSTKMKCSRVLVNGFEILEHPSDSPELAPMDFRFIPENMGKLPGMRFEDASELYIYTQNCVSS